LQSVAAEPSAQLIWQLLLAQFTTQLPEHSTVHEPTLVHVTSLFDPT
jgi:hypothetical protein